jgi:predicted amidophosphoribosyltransferase
MVENQIYCKKCGAKVAPINGECPRCGYVFGKKSQRLILILLAIGAIIFLIKFVL